MSLSKKLLISLYLISGLFASIFASEIQTLKVDQSITYESYAGPITLQFAVEIPYILDPKGKLERLSAMPFRGIYLRPKKGVYSVNEPWFEEKVDDIVEYCQNTNSLDKLFEPTDKKDTGKAIACKAFYEDLLPLVGNKQPDFDLNALKTKMKQLYIETALIYAHKYNHQKKAKSAPKFGTLTKVLQPLMSSFAYANPYIAVAECYDSSESIKKGKEIFRGFFLNKNLMMVLRRRMQFPFSENRLDWSMLNMDPETFATYQKECVRTWIEQKQYLISSKIEKGKKGQ
jgi:hypothetical protein